MSYVTVSTQTYQFIYNLKLSRRPHSLKSSQAYSRVNWLQEETDVSGLSFPKRRFFPATNRRGCVPEKILLHVFFFAFILFCISVSAVWAYFSQIYFQTFSQNKGTNLVRFSGSHRGECENERLLDCCPV
jgi:hypothetical protein